MTLSLLAAQDGHTHTSELGETALPFIWLFLIAWLGKRPLGQGFRRIP
jgi:hypothetical protein